MSYTTHTPLADRVTAFVAGDNHLAVTTNVTGDIKPPIHKVISRAQRVFHRPTHKIVQGIATRFSGELDYRTHPDGHRTGVVRTNRRRDGAWMTRM